MESNMVTIPCDKLKEMQAEIATLTAKLAESEKQLAKMSEYANKRNDQALDLQEQLAEAMKDAARLNFLEIAGQAGMKWIARKSVTGRGYRLHQDPSHGEFCSARLAIDAAIRAMKEE